MSDAQLALSSQQGDRAAFSALAARLGGPLQRFLRRELGDAETARDVCQETFMRAWLCIDRLRDPERFSPWIHRIALNLCRDRRRSLGRGPHEVALTDDVVERRSSDPDPFDRLQSLDAASQVDALLDRLPDEQRTAILLREVQGLTSTEIGIITGVPPATVRTRIYYGLRTLRTMLPHPESTGGDATMKGSTE